MEVARGDEETGGFSLRETQPELSVSHLHGPATIRAVFAPLLAEHEQLRSLLDITIHYPGGNPSFWGLMCGKVTHVVMHLELKPIPAEFIGRNYQEDEAFRAEFQAWVTQLWLDKDAHMARLHQQYPTPADRAAER